MSAARPARRVVITGLGLVSFVPLAVAALAVSTRLR